MPARGHARICLRRGDLGLVERAVPVTETQPQKSRRARYRILDPYFRFWFRFIYPNRSLLERGVTAPVLAQIAAQLDQYTGPAFEVICHDHIWRLAEAGALGFTPRAVGRWWNDREEIDLVAIGGTDILFGECKWSTGPDVLADLRRKSAIVLRDHPRAQAHYALLSRSGFTAGLNAQELPGDVALLTLSDIMA